MFPRSALISLWMYFIVTQDPSMIQSTVVLKWLICTGCNNVSHRKGKRCEEIKIIIGRYTTNLWIWLVMNKGAWNAQSGSFTFSPHLANADYWHQRTHVMNHTWKSSWILFCKIHSTDVCWTPSISQELC